MVHPEIKFSWTQPPLSLIMMYGSPVAELSMVLLQSLRYPLSAPLQKKFTAPQ